MWVDAYLLAAGETVGYSALSVIDQHLPRNRVGRINPGQEIWVTAYDRVESLPHAKLSDAIGLLPHPEDISARVSLALQQIHDPTEESLRQATTLLIETVEQILGTVTAQQATIASLEARLEMLEQLAATSADVKEETLEFAADLGVHRCDSLHNPSCNDRH